MTADDGSFIGYGREHDLPRFLRYLKVPTQVGDTIRAVLDRRDGDGWGMYHFYLVRKES